MKGCNIACKLLRQMFCRKHLSEVGCLHSEGELKMHDSWQDGIDNLAVLRAASFATAYCTGMDGLPVDCMHEVGNV